MLNRSDPSGNLLATVVAFYRTAGRDGDRAVNAMLDGIAAALMDRTAFEPPVSHRSLPVADLLLPALERIDSDSLSLLREALREAAASFHWRQNPNYSAANMGEAFMAGYGYVEFAGPKEALFHTPHIRVGLLVLGPGLHYPPHAHPAEEIYHPLTDGLWRRGAQDWRAVAPGHAIHHAPMVTHETKATERTLLALYCWRGDTVTEARLTV